MLTYIQFSSFKSKMLVIMLELVDTHTKVVRFQYQFYLILVVYNKK
jgi:hypothetical protein